jgi:hypothetical protein
LLRPVRGLRGSGLPGGSVYRYHMVDPAPVVKPPHDKFRHGDGAGPRLGPHIRVAGHAHPPMLRLLGIRPRYNGYTENVFPALPFHAGMSGRAHPEPPSRTR